MFTCKFHGCCSMKIRFMHLLLLLLLHAVPGSMVQAATQPGLVLSFDDTYVDQWYDFFGQRTDVKATFFVSYWHTLTPAQIDKLRQLEAGGHEIGAHSHSHVGVGDTAFNFDPALTETYVDEQVLPALANMVLDGFNPLSFSYPSGERDENYDAAIRPYFPYLRSTFADENKRLYQLDDIFHDENKQYGFLSGDGIDNSYGNDLVEIEEALLRAKNNNEILTLYAHRIVDDNSLDADHNYGVKVSRLEAVIAMAKNLGLKFYTFQEAYQVGNPNTSSPTANSNISVAIENNRVQMQWDNTANDFIGIVPLGTAGWQEGMPGVWTDGSASGKAGVTVSDAVAGQQYVAMFYSNFIKVAESDPFVIIEGTGTGAGGSGTGGTGSGSGTGGTGTGSTGGSSTGTIEVALENNRVRLSWKDVATTFIGIVPQGQSEWQEGMPGAVTDGSSSGKMGITVNEAVAGQQYVALLYNNGVKVSESAPFVIIASTGSGTDTGTGGTDTGSGTGGTDTGTGGTDTGSGTGGAGTGGSTGTIEVALENNRVRLSWKDMITTFIGIVPQGQSEWQEGMPGAVADGSSSGKIGITVSDAVAGQQYVAIFYNGTTRIGASPAFTF